MSSTQRFFILSDCNFCSYKEECSFRDTIIRDDCIPEKCPLPKNPFRFLDYTEFSKFVDKSEKAKVCLLDLFDTLQKAEDKHSSPDLAFEDFDDKKAPSDWGEILSSYVSLFKVAVLHSASIRMRKRLLQIAGIALHAVMSMDRKAKTVELKALKDYADN